MSDPIIQVENLGKKYRLRQQSAGRYTALRDVLASKIRGILRPAAQKETASPDDDFWALNDVSFEINRGQVVGIIGRNGAGKSTLLKVVSRITEPTTGRVTLRGRVASLLEVGTGFHPELTGRENIYLNGAILGMTKVEIRSKFDEIVAFAEVARFLDTPVKRYSSGMYVRLAFAVAAHLEPEILVVDEVLAVGDAQFQKKCMGKMGEVARAGRTILFVSHNLNAVENLCSHAILLNGGKLQKQGDDVRGIITTYLASSSDGGQNRSEWRNTRNEFNHPALQPLSLAIVDSKDEVLHQPARSDDNLTVVIVAEVRDPDPALNFGFAVYSQASDLLLWSLTTDGPEDEWPKLSRGIMEFRCRMPARFFNEGSYRLDLNVSLHCRDWMIEPGRNSPSITFEIRGGLSDSPYWIFARPGLLAPEWGWTSRTLGDLAVG